MNLYSSFQEMASYPILIPEEELETVYLREEKKRKIDKKKIEEILPIVDVKKPEVEIPEPMIKREIKKKKKLKLKVKEEPKEIGEEVKEIEVVKKPPAKKKRKREILRKVCSIEICKPEVCCADLEGKLLMIAQIEGPVWSDPLFIRRIIAFIK